METPKSSTLVDGPIMFIIGSIYKFDLGIGKHVGARTNITKLFGVKKTRLMMPNHIQHSSQIVGYHNQLHLLHQSIVSYRLRSSLV